MAEGKGRNKAEVPLGQNPPGQIIEDPESTSTGTQPEEPEDVIALLRFMPDIEEYNCKCGERYFCINFNPLQTRRRDKCVKKRDEKKCTQGRCNATFLSLEEYIKHCKDRKNDHLENKCYRCDVQCITGFEDHINNEVCKTNYHCQEHHTKNPCSYVCKKGKELLEHKRQTHPGSKFEIYCTVTGCKQNYPASKIFVRDHHACLKKGIKLKAECPIPGCAETLTNHSELYKHLKEENIDNHIKALRDYRQIHPDRDYTLFQATAKPFDEKGEKQQDSQKQPPQPPTQSPATPPPQPPPALATASHRMALGEQDLESLKVWIQHLGEAGMAAIEFDAAVRTVQSVWDSLNPGLKAAVQIPNLQLVYRRLNIAAKAATDAAGPALNASAAAWISLHPAVPASGVSASQQSSSALHSEISQEALSTFDPGSGPSGYVPRSTPPDPQQSEPNQQLLETAESNDFSNPPQHHQDIHTKKRQSSQMVQHIKQKPKRTKAEDYEEDSEEDSDQEN